MTVVVVRGVITGLPFSLLQMLGIAEWSSILPDMAEATMKQMWIIATIKKCRIPCVTIPIQEKIPGAQSYLESGPDERWIHSCIGINL